MFSGGRVVLDSDAPEKGLTSHGPTWLPRAELWKHHISRRQLLGTSIHFNVSQTSFVYNAVLPQWLHLLKVWLNMLFWNRMIDLLSRQPSCEHLPLDHYIPKKTHFLTDTCPKRKHGYAIIGKYSISPHVRKVFSSCFDIGMKDRNLYLNPNPDTLQDARHLQHATGLMKACARSPSTFASVSLLPPNRSITYRNSQLISQAITQNADARKEPRRTSQAGRAAIRQSLGRYIDSPTTHSRPSYRPLTCVFQRIRSLRHFSQH